MAETTYIVLRRYDARDMERQPSGAILWEEVNSGVPGTSAEAAIRVTAGALGAAGIYVASPMRSWKPTKVSAVQTTVLKLETAAE